ncbi:Hypothetical protein A7982_07096 [Minicystis rosea]|nr:Hypothetical protein A7982_07096 [Minicystis rosea]
MGLLFAAVLVSACGGKEDPPKPDGGEIIDAGNETDAGQTDAGPDGSVIGSCDGLDRPTDLPRPPTSGLPCELLPPGFVTKGN